MKNKPDGINNFGGIVLKKNGYYIGKVIADVFKITPISVIIIVIYYFFTGVYPGIITYLSNNIFQTASELGKKSDNVKYFFGFVVWFILIYILKMF